jgi:pyruvate/2-oxoglutarate dehydrogenase complex dihydrolipoamide acyltransferase (E2) component
MQYAASFNNDNLPRRSPLLYVLTIPGPIEDVDEVRLLEWHGTIGCEFQPGDLVVEFETHKAVVEVRAGQSGVLRSILSPEGDWQKIGQPVALLSDTEDEPLTAAGDSSALWRANFEIT